MSPPKLLFFAPCERVIVDKETNTTSLIAILESLTINVKEDEIEKITEDVKVPLNWSVIAMWQQVEPEGKWEQRLVIDLPNGLDITMKIECSEAKPHWRNVVNISGFPIGQALNRDSVGLKIYIRQEGENQWELVAEYPLRLRRRKNIESETVK